MRYIVGALEALLALGCFGTLVSQLIAGKNEGAVGFGESAFIFGLGFWFAKMAAGNFKAPKSEAKRPGQ